MSERPRRILIVTDLWDTHPNGPATTVRNLKRELEARGHAVDLTEPGMFFTVPFPLYPEVPLPLFARGAVRRTILGGNYDDIHLTTEGLLGWYARGICKKRGIPFTTASHGRIDLYGEVWLGKPVGIFMRSLISRFHRPAAIVIVFTKAMESHMRSLGISRIRILPLGVDPIFFKHGTCLAALGRPVFMYFGRVSSEKSVEEFLQADLPGVKLVIGDGPDRKKLQAKYPRVRFAGYQIGGALADWIACADVFVMPSRTDVFPLVVVESLAAGVPVAAYDVAGPREFITVGVNGYLDNDLAAAAKKCLSLSRQACRDSVRQYSWSISADRFLQIAVEAISR